MCMQNHGYLSLFFIDIVYYVRIVKFKRRFSKECLIKKSNILFTMHDFQIVLTIDHNFILVLS